MYIIYDGECPFCTNYVRLTKIRASAGAVKLVDARSSEDPTVKLVRNQGYNLNEGMVVLYGGAVYYGKDAVVLLSSMAETGSHFSRAVGMLLRNRRRAAILYPIMKTGRRITLAILGRSLIQ